MGLAIGTVLIGMVRAASTARGAVARESELQAVTDALTGLGNRRHLLDQLDAKIARARSGGVRLALSLIDLDGFKESMIRSVTTPRVPQLRRVFGHAGA